MDINNYNKVSEQIMVLGDNASLRMCTMLTRKTQDGYKKSFYAEYEYNTDKFVDAKSMRTIKKDYDYFITLDIFSTKDNVILRAGDMFRLNLLLKSIYEFYTMYADRIFRFDKEGNAYPDMAKDFVLRNLPMNKSIKFTFAIISYDNSKTMGMKISISDESYTNCNMNDIYSLIYHSGTLNMFQAAQIAVASLGVPLETNLNTIGEIHSKVNHNIERRNQQEEIMVSKKRTINKKQYRSFFDKMADM